MPNFTENSFISNYRRTIKASNPIKTSNSIIIDGNLSDWNVQDLLFNDYNKDLRIDDHFEIKKFYAKFCNQSLCIAVELHGNQSKINSPYFYILLDVDDNNTNNFSGREYALCVRYNTKFNLTLPLYDLLLFKLKSSLDYINWILISGWNRTDPNFEVSDFVIEMMIPLEYLGNPSKIDMSIRTIDDVFNNDLIDGEGGPPPGFIGSVGIPNINLTDNTQKDWYNANTNNIGYSPNETAKFPYYRGVDLLNLTIANDTTGIYFKINTTGPIDINISTIQFIYYDNIIGQITFIIDNEGFKLQEAYNPLVNKTRYKFIDVLYNINNESNNSGFLELKIPFDKYSFTLENGEMIKAQIYNSDIIYYLEIPVEIEEKEEKKEESEKEDSEKEGIIISISFGYYYFSILILSVLSLIISMKHKKIQRN
ncbi:MAG: hypothetical protein ACTSRP_26960 [Candidatus Helarchaeota archaeon]